MSYLSPKTAVQSSPIHGRGLFAISKVQAGEIVCVKGGHIFNRATLLKVSPGLGPAEMLIGDDLFMGPVTIEERDSSMIFQSFLRPESRGARADRFRCFAGHCRGRRTDARLGHYGRR
jgi:hypothetical protein